MNHGAPPPDLDEVVELVLRARRLLARVESADEVSDSELEELREILSRMQLFSPSG